MEFTVRNSLSTEFTVYGIHCPLEFTDHWNLLTDGIYYAEFAVYKNSWLLALLSGSSILAVTPLWRYTGSYLEEHWQCTCQVKD